MRVTTSALSFDLYVLHLSEARDDDRRRLERPDVEVIECQRLSHEAVLSANLCGIPEAEALIGGFHLQRVRAVRFLETWDAGATSARQAAALHRIKQDHLAPAGVSTNVDIIAWYV